MQNKTSGTILHGGSTEHVGYLELCQTFTREHFCKKSTKKQKGSITDVQLCSK